MGNIERNNGCSCRDASRPLTRRSNACGLGRSPRAYESRKEDSCPWRQERTDYPGDRAGGQCGCTSCQNRSGLTRNEQNGNGCGCSGRDCRALMRQLQQLDFSIQETVLYLDAYPNCCEALSYYRELVKKREQVARQYEEHCGPLTSKGNGESREWKWIATPWPWHTEFPGNKA